MLRRSLRIHMTSQKQIRDYAYRLLLVTMCVQINCAMLVSLLLAKHSPQAVSALASFVGCRVAARNDARLRAGIGNVASCGFLLPGSRFARPPPPAGQRRNKYIIRRTRTRYERQKGTEKIQRLPRHCVQRSDARLLGGRLFDQESLNASFSDARRSATVPRRPRPRH